MTELRSATAVSSVFNVYIYIYISQHFDFISVTIGIHFNFYSCDAMGSIY